METSSYTPDQKIFTILLVDDRPENLIALEDMLTEPDRVFLKATSGNEALKMVLKHPETGLILLDVQMPDMDGFEVASILKGNKKTRDISIIFVTAISKEEQFALRGFGQGAVDYLHKPLNIGLTRAKVRVFEQLYFFQEELKNVIAERESINRQLERFSYTVAHDLKSPLAGISSLLTLLSEDERITHHEDLNEYTTLLINASEHLAAMISTLLEHSKTITKQQPLEVVNVQSMLTDMIRLLFIPPRIKVVVNPSLPVLKTNKPKLELVFQNLVANAVKHNDKEQGIIEIGSTEYGDFIRFFVKDNGPGIERADQEKIFRLFEKGKGEHNTGIGLNIAKVYVEEQGGNLTVNSQPGEGSCFYFDWKNNTAAEPDIY